MPKAERGECATFDKKHNSSPSLYEAYNAGIITQAIAYFESFPSAESVIDACTDRSQRGAHVLHGWKFPVCIVTEALNSILESSWSPKLKRLRDDLMLHLRRSVAASRFCYFEESAIPEDLDTAASIMRLLGREDSRLRNTYRQILDRNRLANGMYPTWLDVTDHCQWKSGPQVFHTDVMLNHWLTDVYLGERMDWEWIVRFAEVSQLQNYWYIQSMYTPLLYLRLVLSLGTSRRDRYCVPLRTVLKQYSTNERHFLNSAVEITAVKSLVRVSQHSAFNDCVRSIVSRHIKGSRISIGFEDFSVLYTDRPAVLYWSLGYKPYSSLPVTYAMAVNIATIDRAF